MKYRKLGKSGLEVSEISFGTGDNAGLLVNGTEREQLDAVARALELGVNYFDTCPAYGNGAAERNLGRVLKKLGAKGAIVATKVEIMPDELDQIEEKFTRSLDGSLDRLGMESVDIVMMHNKPKLQHEVNAHNWTPLTPEDMMGPALRGFEKAQRAGKARFFGFVSDEADRDAVLPLLQTGKFAAVNVWFNLVNASAGVNLPAGVFCPGFDDYSGVLDAAYEAGVGTSIIRPLDGGSLTIPVADAGSKGRHRNAGGLYTREPDLFEAQVQRGRVFRFLDRPGRTLPQAAFAFILAHPGVSTVIGGFSDKAQFEELASCSGGPGLNADEMAEIQNVYRNNFFLDQNTARA